jgi:hypothetical protein
MNLLEEKLKMMRLPFYSKGNGSAKDREDSTKYNKLEVAIQTTWMKHPDWCGNLKEGVTPYAAADKLPAKGSKVLFIRCDKIKDKKAMFGFTLGNYRIDEGTFHGMKVKKDDGTDYCRPNIQVKVLHKDGYIYFINPNDVILK